MENTTFNIGGINIVLGEQDYVAAVIFERIYSKVNLELYMYEQFLAKAGKFDTWNIKRCLKKIQLNESLDDSLNELIVNMEDFVWSDELEEICDEIKQCFGISYLRTYFSDNNIQFDSFDFNKCVEEGADKLLKIAYDERVKNNEDMVKGVSFQEYKNMFNTEVATDINDAYRVGEEVQLMGKDSFITKYESLIPLTDEHIFGISVADVKKMCQVILQLKEPANRERLTEKFRQECLMNIFQIMEDLEYKFHIPLQINYFSKSNYENYIRIYESQLSKQGTFYQNKLIVENLTRFPFLDKQYRIVLNAVGDSNKDLEKYAEFFSIDLRQVKKEEFERFVESNIKINMDDEKQVQAAYDKIVQYRKFIGYDNTENKAEQKLKSSLDEFDIRYRTVNGNLYDTREKADEVRSRSFEGKEYDTKEQAELVKSEVESVRQVGTYTRTIEKYRKYKELANHAWKSEEALDELKKLDGMINDEYKEMHRKSDEVNSSESSLKIAGAVGIVVTILGFLIDSTLGLIILIISLIVIYTKYNKMRECKSAREDLIEMNHELGIKETSNSNHAAITSGNNICPRCGSAITDDMKFCTKCGMKLNGNSKS